MAIIIVPDDVLVTADEYNYFQQLLNQMIDDGYWVGKNPPSLEEFIKQQRKMIINNLYNIPQG